ncbi:MAG: hypothetical protein JSS46_16130 [Proteobacteria bacterium]|nr:hypothetical protein [Pseudomonadota bacterium]
MPDEDDFEARRRAAARRTGFGLLVVALIFFFGFIASRLWLSPDLSLGVIGAAVVVFVVVAVGRHLRK